MFARRPSDQSALGTEISRLFGQPNLPLDSGERPAVRDSLMTILDLRRSMLKISIGGPACSLSRRHADPDLFVWLTERPVRAPAGCG
jgi:hypothetical protein